EAVAALNRTRERANISLLNTSTSKEEFLTELQAEYRREFVGEGHFWHYLVRSENAVSHMNAWLAETEQSFTINEDKLIYPIPFSQLLIKPGLYEQNPGY
ncbi:MAG: RagB/SusD family nutrient uptake outer membrane protein, partial [Lewinella sp.]